MTMRLVVALDVSKSWLDRLRRIVNGRDDLAVDTFVFPDDLEAFRRRAIDADVVLIDHKLGGENGASIAKDLLSQSIRGEVYVVTAKFEDHFADFSHYVDKWEVLIHPEQILEEPPSSDIFEQAVETSILMQKNVGIYDTGAYPPCKD